MSKIKVLFFLINGDSMLPIPHGSWVTGEFVQDWNNIKSGLAHIILTLNEGVLFKIVENRIGEDGMLRLHSLNTLYVPYSIHVNEIREVWKFIHYISSEMPDARPTESEIMDNLREIRKDMKGISERLSGLPEIG